MSLYYDSCRKKKGKFIEQAFHLLYWNLFIYIIGEIFQLLTLRLLLIPSNWPAVFSPMLCEPHSSKPILAYVNVIDPIGRTYVNTMKITLYLEGEGENSSVDPEQIREKRKSANERRRKEEKYECSMYVYFVLS